MFRYYQTSDTSRWEITVDENYHEPWKCAEENNADRVTILTINSDPEITEESELKYRGPLYFDIDHEDLNVALKSGIDLCHKLLDMDVSPDDIEIHLSGSKGVHIFVDSSVFGVKAQLKYLPLCYKAMAIDLYVEGVDMAVYSCGMGRMFRPPNSIRPDGRYKVRVSLEELKGLNRKTYKDMVSSPRNSEFPDKANKKAAKLTTLWRTNSSCKPQETSKASISDEVFARLEGQTPQCIKDISDGHESSGNNNFNTTAINFSCWAIRSGQEPALIDSLISRISDNCTSKKYNTARQRKTHLKGVYAYVKSKASKYTFTCAGMKSCVSTKPCRECPIKNTGEGGLSSGLNELFLHENMGQYYQDAGFERVVTSFTMERQWVVADEDTDRTHSSVFTITSPQRGKTYKINDFDEAAWNTKAGFKAEIQGLDGVAFVGSENDVTRLRLTIARDSITGVSEVRQTFKISKVGIHHKKKSGPDDVLDPDHKCMFVYAEPGFSITNEGQLDSYVLSEGQTNCPNMKVMDFTGGVMDQKTNSAFSMLMASNKPEICAQIIGWYIAAHLRSHFYALYKRFPPMCISGVAGVGKNAMTAVMQRISGLSGDRAGNTLEAPNCTKLPFQQQLTNSTTVPRVINELNRKSVSNAQYGQLIELVKASFDSMEIQKGRMGGGDKQGVNVSTVSWKVTAPVVTLSEEPISVPAVLQRAIMIQLDPVGHNFGADNFMKLETKADRLVPMAPILSWEAMQTTCTELDSLFHRVELPDEVFKSGMPERSRYGYQVVLAALSWAIQLLPKSGLNPENEKQLKFLYRELYKYLADNAENLSSQSSTNEVDKVLKDIALLANNYGQAGSMPSIEKGTHFLMLGGFLYLDTMVIFPTLEKFKSPSMNPLGIKTHEALIASCRGLPYYVSNSGVHELLQTSGRGVLKLSVPELQEANIPVQMFE